MLWLVLLAAGAAAAAAALLRRRMRGQAARRAHREMPCGIPSYPVIGHAHLFLGTDEDRMNALIRIGRIALENKGFTSFWLASKLYVVIAEPPALELVARTCLEKDEATMKFIRLVLGNGMVFAPVNIWRHRRKVMAPTFSMRNLQQFVPVFDRQAAVMAARLGARAGHGDFSIWDYITTYTFDSICETVMGIELNAQRDLRHPFITAIDVLTHILARRILSPWLYWDWAFRLTPLHTEFMKQRQWGYDFFDKVLKDKRKRLAEGHVADKDGNGIKTFLDTMVESPGDKAYSDEELREEVLAVVTAGTDTSAVATAFAALLLARHPRVQDKVYQELQEVCGDSERAVCWQELPRLEYLQAVLQESLRLYPSAPVVVRDVHETVVLRMAVCLHLWATNRSPAYWGADAEQFRPERFLRPLSHPAQFVPFGCAPRNCLGYNYGLMSAKTVLARLLRRWRLLPPAALPPDELARPLRIKFDIVMRHCDNFHVRIEHREKAGQQ